MYTWSRLRTEVKYSTILKQVYSSDRSLFRRDKIGDKRQITHFSYVYFQFRFLFLFCFTLWTSFSYVFDLSASLFYFILLNSLNYYLDKKIVTNVFKYYCSALVQTLFKATFWLLKWNFKYPILIFQDVFPVNEGSRVTSTSMSSAWHLLGVII